MDAETLKTIKEATSNSFRRSLIDIFQSILPLCPQLCEGLMVTTPGAAELFNKVPQYRLDPGLLTVKPKASQQQVLVFSTYDKIAREVDIILEQQILRHQSDIDLLTDQLTHYTGMANTPNDQADLSDLDMETDQMHQSTSSTADPPPFSSEISTNSWKPVLTKNQKKKLKKQEKRAEKAKFLQEAALLNSSTASPDSTLDSQKPILSQSPPQPSALNKRSDKSDDKTATLTTKKRKNESSTGDNNFIITGYQPEENDKNLTLDLVIYDISAKWTNYQLLSELNKWGKVVSVSTRVQKKYQTARVRLTPNHNCLKAYNSGDWTVSLGSLPVR
ncbi:hypothetical protein RclHR1_31960001 [Rhizophagus clarus]|uniref:Uncharacterized protein n=1 Tax=Rhizophagus clarus TaxID=94130 RepID=A0A2Z6RBD6_9GLOM|nr:hypothetical protein RclHR1_31960001 [Rhizophagus clarus]